MVFFAVITGISDIVFYAKTERYIGFGPTIALVTGILSLLAGLMLLMYPNAGELIMTLLPPNLVHRSFCFQIDPHPSGPSGRKILYYYFTLIVNILGIILGCLMIIWAVGSVVFNGLYYWRLSDPSWNRLRGDGLQ